MASLWLLVLWEPPVAIGLGELDYSYGIAAVTVAAVSLTLLVTGFWLDGLIRTEWLRLLTAYPLVWLGLVGLGFIALDIVMKLLVPFVLAIWSSFAG
jgi:hypothetical protein